MKDWRDLFYFSKSERRALTLLSFLILGAWLLLWVTEPEEEPVSLTVVTPVSQTDSVPKLKSQDTVRNIPRRRSFLRLPRRPPARKLGGTGLTATSRERESTPT